MIGHYRDLAACLSISISISACGQQPRSSEPSSPTPATVTPQSSIERGKLLVTIGGCHDCHTPKKLGPKGPEPDMDRALSGHPENSKITAAYTPAGASPWTIATNNDLTAWSGPWGVSFTANLTPDTNTGLRSGV